MPGIQKCDIFLPVPCGKDKKYILPHIYINLHYPRFRYRFAKKVMI